eukprot:COSAG04_NODE_4605_length_1991_cov_1.216702_1_plen_121_part_10
MQTWSYPTHLRNAHASDPPNTRRITPPITDNVLEGITRRTVLEIAAAELGLPVLERSVDRSELYMADEVFECGTGAQITPVREVDDRAVGDGVRDTPELMATALAVVVSTRLRLTTWTWLT